MMTIKMTSLLLAGVLSAMSVGIFAASGDGADATGTQIRINRRLDHGAQQQPWPTLERP